MPGQHEQTSGEMALAFARRAIVVILILGILGLVVELLLIEHFEDILQLIPLALLGLGLLTLGWHVRAPRRASSRALRGIMAACLVSGVLGVFLHYRGNVEFERERRPQASGWELFREAIMGATPALAPGAMIQLGLLGLLYTVLPARKRTSSDVS
jgi:hypothetical protein